MPRCRDCKLYDLDGVKNARGAILSKRAARCLWVSKEQWPEAVSQSMNRRPTPTYMSPNAIHRCPCFQKTKEVDRGE